MLRPRCIRALSRSARARSARRAAARAAAKAVREQQGGSSTPWGTAERLEEDDDATPQTRRLYHDHWRRLVELEWEAEQTVVLERLKDWPLSRLEREGLCLTGLQHRSTGRFFERPLHRFSMRPRREARHEFQVGDAVILSRSHPLSTEALRGEVVELGSDTVAVAVSGEAMGGLEAVKEGAWRLDRGANRTAYTRTVAALGEFCGFGWSGAGVLRKVIMEAGHEQARPWPTPFFGVPPSTTP